MTDTPEQKKRRPQTKKKKLEEKLNALLFVDTNIFLNYYRVRQGKLNLELLEKLEEHKDRLIISNQVEMEYKKNRQSIILETLKEVAKGSADYCIPPIVSDTNHAKSINTAKVKIQKALQAIKIKSQKILSEPSLHDPVYKILQRLFKHESKYNFCIYTAENEEWATVFTVAKEHFEHGFPPRKKDDISCGDAINWQWCLHCVKHVDEASTHDLIIVSNDSDYGISLDGKSYINDWLRQEFSDCVSKKRKVILTNSLAEGLRLIDVTVSREAELAEQREIRRLERAEKDTCFCGSKLMFDAQCAKCWEYVLGDADGECYRIERNKIYETDQFGEEHLLTCSKCGCARMHIEYAETCAHCDYQISKACDSDGDGPDD